MRPKYKKPNSKYKSKFEEEFAKTLPDEFKYETHKFPYVIHANYIPDFIDKENKIIIETKGFLRDDFERRKMIAVKDQHFDWTFCIFFQYPDRRIPRMKSTHREWAERHGFVCLNEIVESGK